MRHSLHSHIIYLEHRIQGLKNRLTLLRFDSDEREGLEQQLALAQLALGRYREAYALELSVASDEPPSQPGGKSEGETGDAKNSTPEKKKEGLAAIEVRASNRPARNRIRNHVPASAYPATERLR